MPSYVTPKKNTAFIFYIGLVSQADTKTLKSAPTLAAGDFKVSIDGAATANLATLPTNTPGGVMVKVSLSSSEMNGDNITVICIDAAGAEWCDAIYNIQTSARQIDDLAYPATSGRSMVVDANGLVDANTVKLGPTGSGTAQTARDVGAQLDAAITTRLAPATAGRTLVVDAAGLADANVVKLGPTGSGTAQTARDIGLSVLVGDKTGFSLSAAGIQAIWDALTTALTTVGSIGKRLADDIDATISSRSTYAGGDTAGTTTLLSRLSAGRATNLDNLDATISSRSTLTAALVWDYLTASITTAGSIGKLLKDNIDTTISSRLATSGYTAPPSAATIAATVWDYLTATIATVGSIGKLLKDNIDVAVSTRLASASYAAAPSETVIADAILARNQQGGSNSAPTVSQAIAGGLMNVVTTETSLTVYHGDGVTPAVTKTLVREDLNAIKSSS